MSTNTATLRDMINRIKTKMDSASDWGSAGIAAYNECDAILGEAKSIIIVPEE